MRRFLTFVVVLLPLVALLPACAADRSQDEVRALTDSFFNALQAGNAADAGSLVLASRGPIWPLIYSASEQKDVIPSYSIERIDEIDAHDVRVVVIVPGTDTTTTITLLARQSGRVWRFDPDALIETRFNGILSVEGPPPGPLR